MGKVIAIIEDGLKGHPHASPWYSAHPIEPIGGTHNITVGSSFLLKPMTLDSIMDKIISEKPESVVVVCHGTPGGLDIPFYRDAPYRLNVDKVVALSQDRRTVSDGVVNPEIKDDAVLGVDTAANVRMLRNKMHDIQAMGLTHVAFRACDLGENVMVFKDLFGAKGVSGCTYGDMYGTSPVEIGGNLTKWMESKRKANPITRTWLDGDVAFAYLKLSPVRFKLSVRARSQSALLEWKKQRISVVSKAGNSILFHAMEDPNAARGTPSINFILEPSFVANLVTYPKSAN